MVVSRLSPSVFHRLLGLALRRPRSCLFRCGREILPRRRLAHCALSRTLASSSSIFRVASSQSHLVVLFCCSCQMRSSSSRYLVAPEFWSFTFFSGFFFVYFTNDANLQCSRPCAGLLRFPRVFTQNRRGKISCFESSWIHRILVLIVGSSVVSSSRCLTSYARAL